VLIIHLNHNILWFYLFNAKEVMTMRVTRIMKRNGKIVSFNSDKITESIFKAAEAVGGSNIDVAKQLTLEVIKEINKRYDDQMMPNVEHVQDIVEKVLIETGHAKTAKTYILYRQKRSEMRNAKAFLQKAMEVVDGYVGQTDWRVKENSNTSFAMSGLQAHISGAIIAEYALENIYPPEIAEAHRKADFHIHDLSNGCFSGYCAGWSLRQLLQEGFNGIKGRVAAKPAKHFNAALGQIMNFFGTLQNEWAGAQAFSSFDTYLAPLVGNDKLDYKKVKQGMQEFIFGINQTSRWGNQVPFTNITMDWVVPEDLKDQKVIIGGERIDKTYSEFQKEMDMINKAFIEVMMEGDADGRIFTFPIPTYNITNDFDWESENAKDLFEMTAKYGTPYFQNFVNSDLKPGDVRSMCCRLQLNVKELLKKTGGLFGSGEQTGSIGVVTLNIPKAAYLSKGDKLKLFQKLKQLMIYAKESLEIKRKECQKWMDAGLLPYSKRYLGSFNNHFSTIGLVGMNEACQNFFADKNKDITSPEGKAFAIELLNFIRKQIAEFQEETGHIYNLEATPAEGTSFRLAKHDKKNYPDIITAGGDSPYYTNSSQLPVGHTKDVFDALDHQEELQTLYTGGTVFHAYIGEKINDWKTARDLIKKMCSKYRLPYFTISPVFSICPVHGYIAGEHNFCPHEHTFEEMEKHGFEIPEMQVHIKKKDKTKK
jgi:ribonucleoside-triphosphate reductase (formate)